MKAREGFGGPVSLFCLTPFFSLHAHGVKIRSVVSVAFHLKCGTTTFRIQEQGKCENKKCFLEIGSFRLLWKNLPG